MIEKSCRCGQSKKNFHKDLGPFYVGECCLLSGFDDLGNPTKTETNQPNSAQTAPKSEAEQPKLKRWKLRDLKLADLRELAKSRGLNPEDTATRGQIIEELLK